MLTSGLLDFVYRLRNALFHEIIDPLNDEWQVIFKNAYHVLKQIVDQNIWRLNQLKLLPLASQAAVEKDYKLEAPPLMSCGLPMKKPNLHGSHPRC